MQNYKRLEVWQASHLLAVDVYKFTNSFPKDELYGLTAQIRRSCVSIPSNIAEGCGREGNTELGRYLQISLGSANELEYQLLLASELKLLSTKDYETLDNLVNKVKGMLISLIQKLNRT